MSNQFYNTPAFDELAKHLTNKSFPQVLNQFVRNVICQKIDPIAEQHLSDPSNNSVFTNKLLTRKDQAKLFIGKVISQMYDTDPTYFPTDDKETMIRLFITELNNIDNLNKTENGKDVYTLLIDHYAKYATNMIIPLFNAFYGEPTEDTTSKQLSKYIEFINSIYTHKSKNLNMKFLDDSDDTDTTLDLNSDSSSDSDSDSPYIPPPTLTNKRKADEEHTPNKKRKLELLF